jgi:hypothetical protein
MNSIAGLWPDFEGRFWPVGGDHAEARKAKEKEADRGWGGGLAALIPAPLIRIIKLAYSKGSLYYGAIRGSY